MATKQQHDATALPADTGIPTDCPKASPTLSGSADLTRIRGHQSTEKRRVGNSSPAGCSYFSMSAIFGDRYFTVLSIEANSG